MKASTIRKFSAYLASERNNGKNTITKKLKGIKALVNSAIREGLMPATNHPFQDIPA